METHVRYLKILLGLVICASAAWVAHADAFKLSTGETLNGEAIVATANDQGMQIKVGDAQFQKVPWGNFSQEDLKNFAKNPKLEPFVQPFIEVDPQEKLKKTEVNIKEPPKLEPPPKSSLLAAMASSSVGLFMLVLLYAANVYAGYEIAIFRARPQLLVCGLAAVPGLGFFSNLLFIALPTKLKASEETTETPAEASVAAGVGEEVNPMHADGAAHPSGLKLADSEPQPGKATVPETVVFERGRFTFNRRFIETKFAGFFGVVRRDAEKDLLLVIKSARGHYITQRISRISASDLHIQVQKGHSSEEVLVPFQEIQEIQLKHKNAQ